LQSLIKRYKRSKFKVATKVFWNKLNIAKDLSDYQKSKHFSNALKDWRLRLSTTYVK